MNATPPTTALSATQQIAEAVKNAAPAKCPITGRDYFMTLVHPALGTVPTYGGPYDSYTIPHIEGEPSQPWHLRELSVHRYDHDLGDWREEVSIPLRIIHDDVLGPMQELVDMMERTCDGLEHYRDAPQWSGADDEHIAACRELLAEVKSNDAALLGKAKKTINPQIADSLRAEGILQVVQMLQKRATDHAAEHLHPTCPETNSAAGNSENLKYWNWLNEIAEEVAALKPLDPHPDDAAVDALSSLMKAKLAKQRAKGYGGWNTEECTQQRLSDMLHAHVDKGDPVDVANFCAFLSARGEGIRSAVTIPRKLIEKDRAELLQKVRDWSPALHPDNGYMITPEGAVFAFEKFLESRAVHAEELGRPHITEKERQSMIGAAGFLLGSGWSESAALLQRLAAPTMEQKIAGAHATAAPAPAALKPFGYVVTTPAGVDLFYRHPADLAIHNDHRAETVYTLPAAMATVSTTGEELEPSDAEILALAGANQTCPVYPWWLKDDVRLGQLRSAVVSFARGVLALRSANAAPAPVTPDHATWCSYIAGMIGAYLGEPLDSERCKTIAGIIERRMWALPSAGAPVIDTCDERGHDYAKLPDHPMRDGRPRCPHCMAIGLDKARGELAEIAAAQHGGSITIDLKQVAELLDLFGGEPTEFTLMQCDGHSGPGLYAYVSEYPEDGTSFLGKTDCEAQQSTLVLTLAELQEVRRAIKDFEDCNETDVPYALLMRAARAGYLECTYFQPVDNSTLEADIDRAALQGGAA